MSCEHNFVTLEGEDWLCHDCEIYFSKHPADIEVEAAAKEDDEKWYKVNEILKGYEATFVKHINKQSMLQAKEREIKVIEAIEAGLFAQEKYLAKQVYEAGPITSQWNNSNGLSEDVFKKALEKFNEM